MNKMFARQLRGNMTDAEKLLWRNLRLRQLSKFKFRRQSPIGDYIIDFVCFEKKLIIEVDGGQHAEQAMDDLKRTEWLQNQGFKILRFWNDQILREIESVMEIILNELTPRLNPPPQGGRSVVYG